MDKLNVIKVEIKQIKKIEEDKENIEGVVDIWEPDLFYKKVNKCLYL